MNRRRRLAIAIAIIVILSIGEVFLLDNDAPIDSYRAGPDNTLTLLAESEPSFWARVTNLEETADTVTVRVKMLRVPLPSTGGDREFSVTLQAPLRSRTVIDGSSGVVVRSAP